MPSYIRPYCEGICSPSALMKGALLLLINLSAFKALDNVSVWRSRSDRSRHQLRSTLGII
jgi:hypothetical protein